MGLQLMAGDNVQLPAASAAEEPGLPDMPVFRDARFYKRGKHGSFREVTEVPRMGRLMDSHCHLQLCASPEVEAARAEVWGIAALYDVVDLVEDGEATFGRLERFLDAGHALAPGFAAGIGRDPSACVKPGLRVIVGCHPENAPRYTDEVEARLASLLDDARVCGIGEAGLELHYCADTRERQEEMFRRHIALAHAHQVPMCLHVRDGHARALEILREEGFPKAGCVLHCFTADTATLEPWLEHDCYVGFDGPLTFHACEDIRAAARMVPEDRLLVETDAPFLAPHPMRGMPCGPAHVLFTAAKLAEVRGVDADGVEEFSRLLCANTERLYGSAR